MAKQNPMQEIRNNFKKLLALSKFIKFNNYKLTDGTMITSQDADLKIGGQVYQLDAQGNQTPLDDGDYVLADGRTITVSGSSITAMDGPEESQDDTESGDDTTSYPDMETSKQKLDDSGLPDGHGDEKQNPDDVEVEDNEAGGLGDRVSNIEKELEEIKNYISQLGSTQNEVNEQMMSKFSKLESEPGAKAIKTRKVGFESYDPKAGPKLTSEELLEKTRKIAKEMRLSADTSKYDSITKRSVKPTKETNSNDLLEQTRKIAQEMKMNSNKSMFLD